MEKKKIPQFPYGAVYFRKSNPPKQDWERDYKTAAEDGCNLFRHWLIWGAVETAPGVYDWSDYDRQMELAEKYGIQVILAEITMSVPAWAAARYPELFPQDIDRKRCVPEMAGNSAVYGYPTGFCLDKPQAREMVKAFLQAAAKHFRGHPALYGYDIANECYRRPEICYCGETAERYRDWLKKKYGSIEAVNESWHVYSFTDFQDIYPPHRLSFFPDSVDWLRFRYEQAYETIRWKTEQIRAIDPDAVMTAHGMADSLRYYSSQCTDHWEAAKYTDIYGVTWVPCRKGNEPWRHMFVFDLVRSACRGEPFWHTEAQGGPLWLQPQLTGRSRRDGRVPDQKDIRLWNLLLMAGGGRGIFYTRWRPLLDGPLFDGFGIYGLDGSRTERSEMASAMAKWANAPEQRELWKARPVPGDIHILFVPECENASFLLAQSGNAPLYAEAAEGAYRGFFSQNIQPDFVHIDQLERESVLYFPLPSAMSGDHVKKLADWVKKGGILICEACPAFFTEHMHVRETQPDPMLKELFGIACAEAEFMPDLAKEICFELLGEPVRGGGFTQFYTLKNAKGLAVYNNRIIAAENQYGAGRTLLIGSNISLGGTENETIWGKLLEHVGVQPQIRSSDPELVVRLHKSAGHQYVWLVNPSEEEKTAGVLFRNISVSGYEVCWPGGTVHRAENNCVTVSVEARNALVLELYSSI